MIHLMLLLQWHQLFVSINLLIIPWWVSLIMVQLQKTSVSTLTLCFSYVLKWWFGDIYRCTFQQKVKRMPPCYYYHLLTCLKTLRLCFYFLSPAHHRRLKCLSANYFLLNGSKVYFSDTPAIRSISSVCKKLEGFSLWHYKPVLCKYSVWLHFHKVGVVNCSVCTLSVCSIVNGERTDS